MVLQRKKNSSSCNLTLGLLYTFEYEGNEQNKFNFNGKRISYHDNSVNIEKGSIFTSQSSGRKGTINLQIKRV